MVHCDPIGTVATPFETRAGAPRQGVRGDATGTIELDEEYAPGLTGIEPGDAVDVIWFAHRADHSLLRLDDGRGVFASRSPARPNPVAITQCRVEAVEGSSLRVRGVDMLDGSPVLDLKAPMRE